IIRIHVGIVQQPLEDGRLRTHMGSSNGLGFGGVICVCTQDDTQDRILVCDGVLYALENQRSDTIATAVTVGLVVEGLTVPRTRKEVAAVKTGSDIRVGHDIRTTGDRRVAVLGPQRVARNVDGGQAGGAGSVDTVARAAEFEV